MGKNRSILFVMLSVLACGCQAGWLKPTQSGFIIQSFTTYDPITGNNTGVITTNGNSYQFAGDNTGNMFIGGPGAQFRGKNDGNVYINGDGAFVLGTIASLATVTNRGKGALLLANLTPGQKAEISDVGNASILIGAGTVSNGQCIVVGDGMESHGARSVTAGSFWGNGAGLTNVSADFVVVKSWAPSDVRYRDNGDGTITDMATGLMWMKNGNLTGTFFTWAAANAYCLDLVTNGYSDWRLPTVSVEAGAAELDTLGRTAGNPLGAWQGLEGTAFTNIMASFGGYYSASTNANGPSGPGYASAWAVFLGNTGAVQLRDQRDVWRVLPVRGTNTGVESHYVTLADSRGLNVGGYGFLTVASGTQLVFVAGAVTNVLDADILHP